MTAFVESKLNLNNISDKYANRFVECCMSLGKATEVQANRLSGKTTGSCKRLGRSCFELLFYRTAVGDEFDPFSCKAL